ncbi:hypothetical protein [Streptomyces sp. NPDC047042]|uniref:hypothetical protein n=1 Tax=Streptomyces sp. NPDC047042 TaxID=3154807 RepID=UPI0033D8ADD1
MSEHTRLLGQVPAALKDLREAAERIQEGDITQPVREIAPLTLRVQQLSMQCTQQFHDLSRSQYAVMTGGPENLAHLAGACAQVSLAATLCNLAIHHRTESLLYEDADPTPNTSREQLRRAGDEMQRAATTYRALARLLSRRLASAAARHEDQQLITHARANGSDKKSGAAAPTPAGLAPKPVTRTRH